MLPATPPALPVGVARDHVPEAVPSSAKLTCGASHVTITCRFCRTANVTRLGGQTAERRAGEQQAASSPEVPVGEGVAGTLLEISFERLSFLAFTEVDCNYEFPRGESACMRRPAGIVVGDAFLQVAGQADVALVGMRERAKKVDVHRHPLQMSAPP